MAYPLIILGAGASYDSIDIEQYSGTANGHMLIKHRPPLTKEIFSHSREIFQNNLVKYAKVNSLAASVLPRLADGNLTFEEILQNFLDNHKYGIQDRQIRVMKELLSLNYYLADLLYEISNNFFEIDNNYVRLINEIENRLMKTFVINFNYDLIFERSTSKIISDIDAYIYGDIKILKVHGACNWVYEPVTIIDNKYNHAVDLFADKADQFFDFFQKKRLLIDTPVNYLRVAKGSFGETITHAFMPALALPLNKKTQYVCPESHVKEFDNNIALFDRVVIIGWRGSDDFIINKLKEKLKDKKLTTFIITNKLNIGRTNKEIKKAKEEIKDQYSKIPQLEILDENIYIDGFSLFMRNHSNFKRILD